MEKNIEYFSIPDVINKDICNGCGNCSVMDSNKYSVKLDESGKYSAVIKSVHDSTIDPICPFSDASKNETQLAKDEPNMKNSGFAGKYYKLYAGFANSNDIRSTATSGGIIRWILKCLLETDKIDGVIHVKTSDTNGSLVFKYGISTSIDEVLSSPKSAYYPVSTAEVLKEIKKKPPGRYVFVGLPCLVKSIRLLQDKDDDFKKKIVYTIGLVCGHLKSKGYADYFANKTNIDNNYDSIDFRYKTSSGGASNYSVRVKKLNTVRTVSTNSCKASNWQYNAFRYPCCNYCDDVFAETADITVGDAWVKPYIDMNKGVSEIVVRSLELDKLLIEGNISEQIELHSLSHSKLVRSQLGGLRDRREGLAYRLWLDLKNGEKSPIKRIQPSNISDKVRKKIYILRKVIENKSHELYRIKSDLSDFDLNMTALYREIDMLPKPGKISQTISKLKFIILKKYQVVGKK